MFVLLLSTCRRIKALRICEHHCIDSHLYKTLWNLKTGLFSEHTYHHGLSLIICMYC